MTRAQPKPPQRLHRPWNHVPELKPFDEYVRYLVWERANRGDSAGCLIVVGYIGYLFILYIALMLIDHLIFNGPLNQPLIFWLFLVAGLNAMVLGPVAIHRLAHRIARRKTQRWLQRYNAGKRLPICLACGYDLQGTAPDATTCPECGSEIPPGPTPRPTG